MYNIQSISIGHDGPVYYFWIPNFGSAYVVGDDGSVWSRYRPGPGSALLNDWKQLKATPDNEMYPQVILCYNRVKYSVKVHQLVCEAVYGNCPPGMQACHNNGNQQNNNWWNLRYDTPQNNQADRIIHGTDSRGEKHFLAKLTWDKVREMRKKFSGGNFTVEDLKILARENNVTIPCIRIVLNNGSWREP